LAGVAARTGAKEDKIVIRARNETMVLRGGWMNLTIGITIIGHLEIILCFKYVVKIRAVRV